MKRRAFIRTGALTAGCVILPKIELSAIQYIEPHYIGIGRGASSILANVVKQNPNAKITEAIGRDIDYQESANQGQIIFCGEPIGSMLEKFLTDTSLLVIFYCLGGKSNADEAITFIEQLKQNKKIFKLIIQFPFSFEGKSRNKQARVVADRLSKITNLRCLHSDYLLNCEKICLQDKFELANMAMYQLAMEN